MLAYLEYGQGPPVILLHGLLGSKANMAGIARVLAERYHTYTVDLRNHGDSFHHGSMTYRTMAADLGGFMDDHEIDRAVIIGHSMGGKSAMQFALSFPERVEKLVVVDIAPKRYENPEWEGYIKAMLSLDLHKLESRKEAERLLEKDIPDTIYRQFLLSNLVNVEDGGYNWKPNLEGILEAERHICAEVTGSANSLETLFITGSNSTYVEDKDREFIKELLPASKFVIVTNAGHLIHIEAREKFIQIVGDFLESNREACVFP